jgi:hypothetical protein
LSYFCHYYKIILNLIYQYLNFCFPIFEQHPHNENKNLNTDKSDSELFYNNDKNNSNVNQPQLNNNQTINSNQVSNRQVSNYLV